MSSGPSDGLRALDSGEASGAGSLTSGRKSRASRAVTSDRLSLALDGSPALARAWCCRKGRASQNHPELSCLASWLVISTLRGLADSCTGIDSVSTPAL